MKKKIQLVLLSILCMRPWMGSHAQSMYGDAVKADVKMKYVYSLDEALQLAKKEKKPIFCNCFEDWAMPCHGMNKKVFSNQEFADWMDKHFVNLFMDMSTEEGKKFRETYQIKFMAHYVVLDREGNLIHRIVGGAELPTFQEKVACALSPKTSLAGMSRTYEKEKKHNKEFLLRYADVLRTANEGEKYKQVADEYFQMLKPQEWSEVKNWTIFSERVRGNDTIALDYLISHKADFVEDVKFLMDDEYVQTFERQSSFPAINIGHLGIREDWQSKGIGSQIVDFILYTFSNYRLSGCQFITVDSLNNSRTNKFYMNNGFVNQTNNDSVSHTRRMYMYLPVSGN